MADRRAVCFSLLLVLATCAYSYAADVVLIRSAAGASSEQHQLELAAQFYGLTIEAVTVNHTTRDALSSVRQKSTLAVAIEADALARLDQKALLRSLERTSGSSIPLLIFGVTAQTQPALLRNWSGNAIAGVNRISSSRTLHYEVGRIPELSQQLTGLEILFPSNETFSFALTENSQAKQVLAVRNEQQVAPVFIEADVQQHKVFLLCKTDPAGSGAAEDSAGNLETAFAKIAPVMMFIKYSAGDKGWHSLHHYANLTIDDPWLREPYGNLSYPGLLKEMDEHNFHTTIAFIPWNYDRSEAAAISLFRSHPERFSICVHGDNHDHKEFEDLSSRPLQVQTAALKQSLARMEKFQSLTGIPYDKVFVFPHSIGTEAVLKQLKSYNFEATINSVNVPMDRASVPAPGFDLRPVTLAFGNFPSISRYPAGMQNLTSFLAINDFLDNPLFMYTHQDFFAGGINAFDGIADEVNKLDPDTRWRSAGDIVKHLYLVKLRDDSTYDVQAFSNSFVLENTTVRDLVFDVEKQESGSPAITTLRVEGQDYPYQLRNGYVDLRVPVPAGAARSVVIQYRNDLDLASVSIANSSPRVWFLRKISDFRDITLSRYSFGRALNNFYYREYYNRRGVGPLFLIVLGGIVFAFLLGAALTLRMLAKRKPRIAPHTDIFAGKKIAKAASDSGAGY